MLFNSDLIYSLKSDMFSNYNTRFGSCKVNLFILLNATTFI